MDLNESIDIDVVSDYSSDEEPAVINYSDQGPSTSSMQSNRASENELHTIRGFSEATSLSRRKLQASRRHESLMSNSNNSLNCHSSSSFR